MDSTHAHPQNTPRERIKEALTRLYEPRMWPGAKLAHLDEAVDAVLAVRDEELERERHRAEIAEIALEDVRGEWQSALTEARKWVAANDRAERRIADLEDGEVVKRTLNENKRLNHVLDKSGERCIQEFDRAEAAERKLSAQDQELARLHEDNENLNRIRDEREQAWLRSAHAERKLAAIRELHTDSPAGPCPTCYRLKDACANPDDDGLVPYPCPTVRILDDHTGGA